MRLIDTMVVFGDHDDRTLAQLKRCASDEQVADKKKWIKDPVTGKKQLQIVAPGAVSPTMMHEWLRNAGVELRGGGLDESPHVYRRLPEVLAVHGGLIRVLHTLKPQGVAMAGESEYDPYKD